MAYPFDQLSALAKANLDLSLRLADIARKGGEENARAATAAVTALGEAARPATSPENKAAALSEKGADLFRKAEKTREDMVAETRAAFETWYDAWRASAAAPGEAKTVEPFASMLRLWQDLGSPKAGK
ncbi:hypothetical protein [Sphingomonas oryzagri]